jgi:hypothetical protein
MMAEVSAAEPTSQADPIAVAREKRKEAQRLGNRTYECHLCLKQFVSGVALKQHLMSTQDEQHEEHRRRMQANTNISKDVSVAHRKRMIQEQPSVQRGVGARVYFIKTGDVVQVTGKLNKDFSWQLTGGRICKMKTEGQTWMWESDWQLWQKDAKKDNGKVSDAKNEEEEQKEEEKEGKKRKRRRISKKAKVEGVEEISKKKKKTKSTSVSNMIFQKHAQYGGRPAGPCIQ